MRITDVLKDLGIQTRTSGEHEHARAGWVQIDCPWCSKGWQHYRLGINLSGVYANCWSCGRVDLVAALCDLTNLKHTEIRKRLEGVVREAAVEIIRGTLELPRGIEEQMQGAHRRYLKKRGFDYDEIKRLWNIKCIGVHGLLMAWRIFIPIFYQNQMVSWTTRSISDEHATRYRSAAPHQEKINHKDILYGEDYARNEIIVTEGPLDAWAIGPGAVATCGIGFSRAQLAKIARYPLRVVCFDAEPDGQRRATDLCDQLEPFPGQTFLVTLGSKDPAAALTSESGRKELRKLRAKFLGV